MYAVSVHADGPRARRAYAEIRKAVADAWLVLGNETLRERYRVALES